MKARTKKFGTRAVAMLLSAVTAFSLFPVSAGAASRKYESNRLHPVKL